MASLIIQKKTRQKMGRAKQRVKAGNTPPWWHLALSGPLLPTEPLQQPAIPRRYRWKG